jgi:hypothetical protein
LKPSEYPQRRCREHQISSPSGPIEHSCELPEFHAGPPASTAVPESVRIRDEWEAAHPGWEKQGLFDDPFAEIKP